MVEPSRKKDKDHHQGGLTIVPKVELPSPDSTVFVTTHPTHPGKIDLDEFIVGSNGPKDPRVIKRWGGNFTGRPELLRQLLPHIHDIYDAARETTCRELTKMLRTYWRIFDQCDATPDMAPVRTVADFNGVHEAVQFKAGIHPNISYAFIRLLNAARKAEGLPQLYWAVSEGESGIVRDMLEREQVRAIYNVLKDRVRAIYAAWATDPTLVPSKRDAQDILFFLLVKSGWNEATALNIDIDNFVRPHPTDSDRHILYAVKQRAQGYEQYHTGRNREEWAPANLVTAMIKRTEPLRQELRNELAQLEAAARSSAPSHGATLREAWLRNAIRSPWLAYASHWQSDLRSLEDADASARVIVLTQAANGKRSTSTSLSPVDRVVADANLRLPPALQIRKLTLSDLRDAFIGFAYESSGYQWLMAKLAGGHASIRSAITYLRNRRFKAYGEGKIRTLGNALFDEIRSHKIVEPAILFALVQRGVVTDEQRQRWLAGKDRTRMGTGCRDFKNPPKSVAPEHVSGTGCRPQRCVLCGLAVVFSDSLPHLARRMAELEWLRRETPVSVWIASSFPDEVERLEETMQQFPSDAVQSHLNKWKADIANGSHRPMIFEGSYG